MAKGEAEVADLDLALVPEEHIGGFHVPVDDTIPVSVSQGIGNLASGLFGGIHGAGATMGTVVNIQTGGRSALSGLTRALLLLIVVMWAADLTAEIPLAVLAGIAMKVGVDIIDWSFLKRAHRVSWKTTAIMYGVIALTVFVDLIAAVAIGVFIANLLTIERMAKLQSHSVKTFQHGRNVDLDWDALGLEARVRTKIGVWHICTLIETVESAVRRQAR